MYTEINFWAIIISMVLSVVLGFLWYGPLFGKQWMTLSGIKMPDQKPGMDAMIKPIILSLIGAFLMSFVLSFSITFGNSYVGITGIAGGLTCAFFNWLGFVVPTYLNFTGWEGKSWTLFFINTGYWLVFLLLSSIAIVLLG